MNEIELQNLYDEYVKDETIMGIKNLLNKNGIIKQKDENKYKSLMYEKFGKEHLKSIFQKRLFKHTSNSFKEKKKEKLENLKPLAEKIYQEFLIDENILSLGFSFKKNKINTHKGEFLRKILYEKYGENNINKISRKRISKISHKNRKKETYKHSQECIEKIKEGNKKFWGNIDENTRELSRQRMIKYCNPKGHTKEVSKKRIKTRRSINGAGWKPHTLETKNKISKIFKEKWKNGDYENRAKSFISGLQMELSNMIRSLGYTVFDEYLIEGKPYDIFIKEKNLIIEFNGTYWHLDPKIYDKDYYDKSRNKYAHQIWKYDEEKRNEAIKIGYKVLVIWEKEWTICKDKINYIKKLLC